MDWKRPFMRWNASRGGPMAPEEKSAKRPLRHLLYGSRRDVYRVIFEIDERRKRVLVLTIRHGGMERFSY
jgi:mRNA-degrading endonuclease RelE of RelBE toxin-antitoxin system